jgi:hypothetical protein
VDIECGASVRSGRRPRAGPPISVGRDRSALFRKALNLACRKFALPFFPWMTSPSDFWGSFGLPVQDGSPGCFSPSFSRTDLPIARTRERPPEARRFGRTRCHRTGAMLGVAGARIMIPRDFGLAIGDFGVVGHQVGHACAVSVEGGARFSVGGRRRVRERQWCSALAWREFERSVRRSCLWTDAGAGPLRSRRARTLASRPSQ